MSGIDKIFTSSELETKPHTVNTRCTVIDGYPVKFVTKPSVFLCCSICGNVYIEPVILISCGHTYCKKCILEVSSKNSTDENNSEKPLSNLKCPADESPFTVNGLVLNKAVQSQIDDLSIYCRNGLIQNESNDDYICDTSGCQQTVKYGERLEHDKKCDFAWLACHVGGNVCGSFRRKDYQKHVSTCTKHENTSNACNGVDCANISTELQELRTSNEKLTEKVKLLENRVKLLETSNTTLATKLENCLSSMKSMTSKSIVLEEKFDNISQQLLLRHRVHEQHPMSPSAENRLSKISSRNSAANLSTSAASKLETWEMPFQFKCIGTFRCIKNDKSVVVFDIEGRVTKQIPLRGALQHRGHLGAVWCLQSWKSNLFSSGADGVIKVWDLDKPALGCSRTVTTNQPRVHAMAVGQSYLYTAGDDLSLKSWTLADLLEHVCVQDAHEQNMAALICVNNKLFSSSFTVIKVWNCETLELLQDISGLYHWVRSLASNPAKDKLYSGSHGTINIWNVTEPCSLIGKISHSHGSVHALAVTQKYIIAGTYNNNMDVFDVVTLQHIHHLTGHVGVINCVIVSPSGRFMFSGSSDSCVMVWSLEKMLPIMTLQRHNDSVSSIVINGDDLLTGSEDTEIKVFKHFRMQMGFQPS